MADQEDLYTVLNRLRDKDPRRRALSIRKIAVLSGLRERTVANWFHKGNVAKPRNWRDLIKLAITLMLAHDEVEELLAAARRPSLDELRSRARSAEDRNLLAPWPSLKAPFRAENVLPYFTDREDALAEMIEVLTNSQSPTLVSIEGMPGVGKTEIASIIAQQLRTNFHDGVLWVDVARSDPLAKLGELARELRNDLSHYEQLSDRSRAFKEILQAKKVLIILDGVTSDKQVDPFVPPPRSPSAVIVTTQKRDLWTTRSARSVFIREFTDADAINLFIKVLGQNRVLTEQQAFQTLAHYAGNLPLAIDIMAHSLRRYPDMAATDYLQLIEESEGLLLNLKFGTEASIFNMFETSYRQLPPPQQQFFASLGVLVGPDFSADAAAYVNRLPVSRAKWFLHELADASLLKEVTRGRYRLHILLHNYANGKITNPELVDRMIGFYTEYARSNRHDFIAIAQEAGNIRAALDIALHQDKKEEIISGTIGLYKYLEANGLFDEARLRLDQALVAATQLADKAAEARIIIYQADLERIGGELEKAQVILETAILPAEESRDVEARCGVWQGMGTIRAYRRDMAGAENEFQRALTIAREGGYDLGICTQLSNLCASRLIQGKLEGTADMLREGLALSHSINAREIEATILANLASLEDSLGHTTEANSYLKQSLDLARKGARRSSIINLSAHLAATEIDMGDYSGASAHLLEALIQARELGDSEALIRVLRNYGELYSATDDAIAADVHFAEALQLARVAKNDLLVLTILTDWGERLVDRKAYAQARPHFDEVTEFTLKEDFPHFWGVALLGVAEISAADGNHEEACRYAREALALFEKLSDPRVEKTTAFLSKLSCTDSTPG